MKARKAIAEKDRGAYGVDLTPRHDILKTSEPAAQGRRQGGSVAELVSKLKNEAGVLG